ncbi:class I SAM-dependent methyltransferase [Streptomonospora nanhaiensis]|uniref:class I SAM-dependent methyltransferase n=1 Tax=Streptomonospora nanhaiensis TaxID=1323731 RepID=UPI001C990473|nr:class I SAM-dependent methyltransferase [Streptomonospora nanhaiensis]MBX9391859.1 class I SAM-dependent methyltransferase [Streptomonospora nanhaiensis]
MAVYDALVIHGTYRWLWGCPQQRVAALYTAAIRPGDTVLEIGPGAGYFLDRHGPADPADLTLHLLDLNEGPLRASAARLARYAPTLHHHDALTPLPLAPGSVDVAVLSMVLHCLPGRTLADKAAVFDHIATVLGPQGTCIGATVLAQGTALSPLGRAGLDYLNSRRIFCNTGDSLSDLSALLHDRFARVRLAVRGAVALWRASHPRRPAAGEQPPPAPL